MTNSSKHEVLKSALIGLVALGALVLWLKFQPRLPDVKPQEKIGQKLFEKFNDMEQMTKIEFVGVDPATGETRSLALTRSGDEWVLPSMSNFPAGNSRRLAKVVAPLMQLSILSAIDSKDASANARQITTLHQECGLLNPVNFVPSVAPRGEDTPADAEEAPNLAQGAALAITIEGESGEKLVDLLVGARAPESSATRDARFVRLPNEDAVYTVDFTGDSTQEEGTTEFTEFPNRISFNPIDWIDPDLLMISRWDVLFLTSRDYQFNVGTKESGFAVENFASPGAAVFRQTPENSLSRVWSLTRRVDRSADGGWQEVQTVDPESANNEALNDAADALGALKIVDVRQKPEALATIFMNGAHGSQLATQPESLADFGFATLDRDPLDPAQIEPMLGGEGGAIDLVMKNGIKITLVFGRKFDDKRACLATSFFDKEALAQAAEDESEIALLAPEAQRKAALKNERFAKWFYLIEEESYQKIKFRMKDVLK